MAKIGEDVVRGRGEHVADVAAEVEVADPGVGPEWAEVGQRADAALLPDEEERGALSPLPLQDGVAEEAAVAEVAVGDVELGGGAGAVGVDDVVAVGLLAQRADVLAVAEEVEGAGAGRTP